MHLLWVAEGAVRARSRRSKGGSCLRRKDVAADQLVNFLDELRDRPHHLDGGDDLLDRQGAYRSPRSPSSLSQVANCADDATYTMRPSPTQPWAAAHIGQCSPDVKTVAAARSSGRICVAAHRASSNSGCRVASPEPVRLRSSARTVPSPATRTEPNGASPACSASAASSIQRRRCRSSFSVMVLTSLGRGAAPRERHRLGKRSHRTIRQRMCSMIESGMATQGWHRSS